jgi:hypothetical protein
MSDRIWTSSSFVSIVGHHGREANCFTGSWKDWSGQNKAKWCQVPTPEKEFEEKKKDLN